MEVPTWSASTSLSPTPAPLNSTKFVMLYQAELLMTLQVLTPLWPPIILFGFISNSINIVVFLKSGARDNVGVLLISLAVSDLLFLALITPTVCGLVIQGYIRSYPWPFDANIVFFLLYWPAFTAYDISNFISVSLGVIRCACVAMPLKFKMVFTKSRTIVWVFFMVFLAVLLRLPVLTINRVRWITNSATNKSEPRLINVNHYSMSRVADILNRGIVVYLAYTTMIVCVCVLTFKLHQAAQIRRSCTAGGSQPSDPTQAKPIAQVMSSKDMQVVKSVVLVCVIFILAQLSFVLTSTTRMINPEFDTARRLNAMFGIVSQVNVTCSYLNASINIFVYYNFNSKYRATFRSLLSAKIKKW